MSSAQIVSSQPGFLSWRWRVLLPVFAVLLATVMIGAFGVASVTGVGNSPGASGSTPAAEARFQVMRLLTVALAAGIMIPVFVGINWMLERVNRITRVAQALAAGQQGARTGMEATDEIGALGQALDRYAQRVQERQDALRATLRRQRREVTYLNSVLEALPDGVVVQDLDGRVMMLNDRARELIGSHALRSDDLRDVTAVVTDVLGPALAPGLYALGDPRRVELKGGRMLSAQAAAVMSMSNQRVGTVVVLREITDEVRRARARDALLNKLTKDVQTPIADLGRRAASEPTPLRDFAREMTRHAVALQKMIVEMRELTADVDIRSGKRSPHPLPLETLVWAVANEWKQVAQAANLTLNVRIDRSGLFVLGDEHRLRWAIGNIVDNAIKYTPPGGSLSVEIRGEGSGLALLCVTDNGVGIAPAELPRVFTRFYRGNPVTANGRVIRVPGTGQGLSIAKQIVETHGGKIHVKSKQWEGTTVYMALPLTAPVSLELPSVGEEMDGETVRIDTPAVARKKA